MADKARRSQMKIQQQESVFRTIFHELIINSHTRASCIKISKSKTIPIDICY